MAASKTKLSTSQIRIKKVFTTLNTRIANIENKYSELTNSDDDDKENLDLQFEDTYWFQEVHQTTGVLPNKGSMFNETFDKLFGRFC